MIGQQSLIKQLINLTKSKRLPRFIILSGKKGSGKRMMVRLIQSLTGFDLVEVGTKVDDIRELINKSYDSQNPTIYAIYDADNMHEIAKNSLLKVCEEPRNSSFIIMTLVDDNNTLDTIKSRATLYKMDVYKPQEILEYAKTVIEPSQFDFNTRNMLVDICDTPGQVNDLVNLGLVEFMNYVDLVFNNVHMVSGSNAFKIGSSLNLGDDDTKYPLDLFFRAFIRKCLAKFTDNVEMYHYGIKTTSKYLRELRYSTLNKTMLFDNWLLELRDVWLDYAESDS